MVIIPITRARHAPRPTPANACEATALAAVEVTAVDVPPGAPLDAYADETTPGADESSVDDALASW